MKLPDGFESSMRGRVVTITVEAGEPILGLWCETCLLPSLVTVPVSALSHAGVTDLGFVEACTDCGAPPRWIRTDGTQGA